MNLPHLHLILNHVPTIGTAVAVGLLVLSLVRKQEALAKAALEIFCVLTLATLPAYLSGVATKSEIGDMPGVVVEAMDRHHDAAIPASLTMLVTGFVAWVALWRAQRAGALGRGPAFVVLVLAAITLGLMAQAASLGGQVRHPEMGPPPTVAFSMSSAAIATLVNENVWVWPALETIHFVALWLLFGVMLVVNLRLLGLMKSASFAAFHRLMPWAVLGICVNVVTGMMFVIATPEQYSQNISFLWKIILLLVAGTQLLYLTAFDEPWRVQAGQDAPVRARLLSGVAIAAWIGVMFYGRMLPFIGNAF